MSFAGSIKEMKRLLLLGLLFLMSMPIHAQRCAVLDFQIGTGVTEEEIDFITYAFRSNFSIDGYRIIPKDPMNSAIDRLGFNRTDMTQQQALKLGRELEAKLIVVGSLNKFMDEYSVDIRVLDVATGITCATNGSTFDKKNYRTSMEILATKLGEKVANSSNSSLSGPSDSKKPSIGDSSEPSESATTGEINGHEWVDLGLSVRWATCNIGAATLVDYGSYFAWGETVTKETYTWENYKFWVGETVDPYHYANHKLDSSRGRFIKYNYSDEWGNIDNKLLLDKADDAAFINWGSTWRIPTDKEWTELRNKCSWTWTTLKGVSGYTVTGPNGNSIFLPAAGQKQRSYYNGVDLCGCYWSCNLYVSNNGPSIGAYVYFDSTPSSFLLSGQYHYRWPRLRFCGLSVRPVSE